MTNLNLAYPVEQAALIEALLSVDRLKVRRIFSQAVVDKTALEMIEQLIAPALEWVGAEWEAGRLSLSQVYMSGRICEEVVDLLLPPGQPDGRSQPKMAIAVLEDYHMLGKRIVYSVLRANGYELMNYGRLTVDEMVEKVIKEKIEILLISVLMLPSALRVKQLRERLQAANRHPQIVVGGAPFRFDAQLWREVGADACGNTASDALQILRDLREVSR